MNQKFKVGRMAIRMKPWSNAKIWLLALVLAVSFTYVSSAQAFRGKRAKDPDKIIAHLTEKLSLSDEQVTQIRPIIENQAEQQKQLFEKYGSQGRAGKQAMRGEMKTLREETHSKMAAVLTEEQMEKYESLRPKLGRNKQGGRGKFSNQD